MTQYMGRHHRPCQDLLPPGHGRPECARLCPGCYAAFSITFYPCLQSSPAKTHTSVTSRQLLTAASTHGGQHFTPLLAAWGGTDGQRSSRWKSRGTCFRISKLSSSPAQLRALKHLSTKYFLKYPTPRPPPLSFRRHVMVQRSRCHCRQLPSLISQARALHQGRGR